MFGVGVNSDAGLVGNITLDEQNFDWTKVPTSWEDIMEGRAFRGAGERFRLELVPGTQVQRYMISFQEPYLNESAGEPRPERILLPADLHGMDGKPRGRKRQPGLPVHPRLDGQRPLPRTERQHQEPGLPRARPGGRPGTQPALHVLRSRCSTTPATIRSWPRKDTCSRPRSRKPSVHSSTRGPRSNGASTSASSSVPTVRASTC